MGVALLVMWPVLYTDTSGAWTLKSRKQRLAIGVAGVAAELTLAAYATLLWSFLPDGMLRSAVFMLATSTWLLTVIVNINPFMRYDGYFLASDLLDVPNLQERAFTLTRWRLREWLFDFGEPRPDNFDAGTERILIAYGFGVWLYRLFLFVGIALLVYHFFFKALGMALFAVEIGYFIIRPIVMELKDWAKRRSDYRLNRHTILTLAALAAAVLFVLIPWRTSIKAPALLHAEQEANLFAPSGARLDAILAKPGDKVTAGQALYRFVSPDLDQQLAAAQWQIQVLRYQDVFQILDQQGVSDALVVRQQLRAALARESALQQEKARLVVNAPFAGILIDQADPLAAGEWVPEGELLGTVIAPQRFEVESFVAEAELSRLAPGAEARFYGEDPARAAIDLVVADVDQTATRTLAGVPELASLFGGGIAAVAERGQAPVPEGAVYRVLLRPEVQPAITDLALRGTVSIRGTGQSLFIRAWTAVTAILVRETGF